MATKQNEPVNWREVVDGRAKHNVLEKLIEARRRFQEANVKKSGINRYAEFKYFTLEDIIPVKTQIFNELGLVDQIMFEEGRARLLLHNVDDIMDNPLAFLSQLAPDESLIKNPIQKVGAIQTYVRRYLYMLMLDIVEADAIDATSGKDDAPAAPAKNNRPASPEKREEVKKELIDEDGSATEVQIKSIKNGLKKLRSKDEANEPYVKEIVARIKAGLKKAEAEEILLEISNKVKES
jgi:hypothetical protein